MVAGHALNCVDLCSAIVRLWVSVGGGEFLATTCFPVPNDRMRSGSQKHETLRHGQQPTAIVSPKIVSVAPCWHARRAGVLPPHTPSHPHHTTVQCILTVLDSRGCVLCACPAPNGVLKESRTSERLTCAQPLPIRHTTAVRHTRTPPPLINSLLTELCLPIPAIQNSGRPRKTHVGATRCARDAPAAHTTGVQEVQCALVSYLLARYVSGPGENGGGRCVARGGKEGGGVGKKKLAQPMRSSPHPGLAHWGLSADTQSRVCRCPCGSHSPSDRSTLDRPTNVWDAICIDHVMLTKGSPDEDMPPMS